MGRRKRSAADDDSSSSSSSEERRRRKKHKREKHKKDKKERKRTKHHESVDAKASRSKELPTKAFLAFIRKGERDAVVEALEDHPDLMLIRVPAAGRETWSVVHEAVAMCPVTGNGAASVDLNETLPKCLWARSARLGCLPPNLRPSPSSHACTKLDDRANFLGRGR